MQRTPEQQEAITHIAPLICVDAGAGSGKTRVLIERIVYLLEEGLADLDEIVAITFTDKAAAEMKARLRRAFREKASIHSAQEMTRWRKLERQVDAARISTIHAFCTGLLRENALHLGLDPDFGVMSDVEETLLLDKVVTETIHQLLDQGDDALLRLSAQFKTSRLLQQIKQLLRQTTPIRRLQHSVDFSNTDMLMAEWEKRIKEERVRQHMALRKRPERLRFIHELEVFEGCCSKESDKREELRLIMIQALREIGEAKDAHGVQLAVERMTTFRVTGSRKANFDSEETVEALKATQEALKKWLKEVALIEESSETINRKSAELTCDLVVVYEHVVSAVEKAKYAAQQLNFDALITRTEFILSTNENVRQRVARNMKFLLIDEFQDTDRVQLKIAELLCNEVEGPDLFIVGDPKQSIYRFRGAEVEVFTEEQKAADKVIPLNKNFRTLPNVLNFVNDFFKASGRLHAVENYVPMAAHRDPSPEPCVEVLLPVHDLQADSDLQPRQEEAALIAGRIQAMCEGAVPVQVFDEDSELWRNVQYGDIAILFRSLTQVHHYEEALRRQGIPYALASGSGFYARQEVIDVLHALKLILNPWDEPALVGFLRSPLVGLSDDDLLRLAQGAGLARNMVEAFVPEDLAHPERLQHAQELLRELRQRQEASLPALLHYLLETTGYEAILLAQHHGVQKASNLRKLIDLAGQFGGISAATLRAFVAYLDEMGSQAVREPEAVLQSEGAGAVHLLSVHKSKGLEFPVVFVADMGQNPRASTEGDVLLDRELGLAVKVTDDFGTLQSPTLGHAISKRHKNEDEDERARLLYVALTRARDYLVLCGTEKAGKKSWLSWIDAEYGLLNKKHGAVFSGKEWRGHVIREVTETSLKGISSFKTATPDIETMRKQAQPLSLSQSGKDSYAISALLDHMAKEIDFEEEDRGDEESPRMHADALYAMRRGTLVHRLFECWDFRAEGPPEITPLLREARLGLGRRETLREELRVIAERFQETELYQRLRQADEVVREAPFLLKAGEAVISGTIDAWLPEGVIIDYKTGRYHETRHARYEWQLLLYAAAVRALSVGMPTEGILYYADEGIVRNLTLKEDEMDAALREAALVIEQLQAG